MNFFIKKLKIQIDYNYILYFFIVLPFLFPSYFVETGRYKVIEFVITYFGLVLMFLEIIRDRNKQISYCPFVILLVEYFILIFNTYNNQGELWTTINTSIKKLLLCFVVGKAINSEKKSDSLMRAVRDICIIIFFFNFITEVMYPTGIPSVTLSTATPHYFLGNVNSVIRAVFPGLCCSILLAVKNERKISLSLIFFYCGFLYQYILIYHSASTLAALFLIFVWIFFSKFIKKRIWMVYAIILCVVTYIQINLVVMSASPRLLHFLSTLFGKSITFSGRIYIWERALIQIYRNPIWGYGIRKSDLLNSIIGNQFGAHNYFLDLVYQRGLIGLVVFLILIILPLFLLRKNEYTSDVVYYLVGFQSSILFMSLFEPFYSSEARMLPILCCLLLLLFKEYGSQVKS